MNYECIIIMLLSIAIDNNSNKNKITWFKVCMYPLSPISTVSPSKKTGLKSGFKLLWLLLLEKRRRHGSDARWGGKGRRRGVRRASACHWQQPKPSPAKQAKQAKPRKGREEKVPTAAQDRLSEFEIIYGLQRAKLQPREWEARS